MENQRRADLSRAHPSPSIARPGARAAFPKPDRAWRPRPCRLLPTVGSGLTRPSRAHLQGRAWGSQGAARAAGVGSGLGAANFSISNYVPPGPIAQAFITGAERVRVLMGPVGSGKTTAGLFTDLRYSARMPPCKDGVIRAKGMIVRADYRTLYKTTLPSWFSWFPPDFPGSKFIGGADRPATHDLTFQTPRGLKLELKIEFQALGDKRIEDVARGWEGSWAHLEEMDLLDESALDFLFQRSNRYPRRELLADGASLRRQIFGTLNPPGSPEHWVVRRFLRKMTSDGKPSGADEKLYIQPSGLSPDAENLANLSDGFYEELAANAPDWHVQRFVHGKVGWDRSGMPVFPEFDPRLNVARETLKALPGVPAFLGLDISGLHPAAVLVQRPRLQVRVLKEFYYGRVGPSQFAELMLAELRQNYRDVIVERGFYDPSNDYGADKEGGERSAIEIVQRAIGIPMTPAWSNAVKHRTETVRNLLIYAVDQFTRGLICDPGVKMLIEGFMAMYRYRLKPDGTLMNADAPKPEKNEHANVQDALQYVCMGLIGEAGSLASAAKGLRPGASASSAVNGVLNSDFMVV